MKKSSCRSCGKKDYDVKPRLIFVWGLPTMKKLCFACWEREKANER